MIRRILSLGFLAWITAAAALASGQDLDRGFRSPPPDARPWVYWFWLDGNITREGITADLEAMQRTGIGGVLIMEVDQGAPKGPSPTGRHTFTSWKLWPKGSPLQQSGLLGPVRLQSAAKVSIP
jgi:hypothetical protein